MSKLTDKKIKCPEGGFHVEVVAVMHPGETKCKKCDTLKKYWRFDLKGETQK